MKQGQVVKKEKGYKPIVLVGMMGTGKTTFGRLLAEKLDRPFFDSDDVIEQIESASISQIFENKGEKAFRDIEITTIGSLIKAHPDSIIATGGGALTSDKTLSMLHKNSIMIWLQSPPQNILNRIKDDKTRPLLQVDDPLDVLTNLLSERSTAYAQAHIHQPLNEENPLATLDSLLDKVESYSE